MKVDKITLDEIIPSEYNPRVMSKKESERLYKNLKEFGLVDPIIINLKNNRIIGGHQRYNVLKNELGSDSEKQFKLIKLGDIGWVFEEDNLKIKDESHEKALNLALNKISGEWDYPKLDNILEDLQNSNFDMDLTGFDFSELNLEPISENIFENEENILREIEDSIVYETPEETLEREEQKKIIENSKKEEEDVISKKQQFLKIEILFETEEEMTNSFDKLVSQGYNCRMSNS